jgi:hypothetical protein
MSVSGGTGATLGDRAAAVLHGNDAGSWTRAAPAAGPVPLRAAGRPGARPRVIAGEHPADGDLTAIK